MLSGCRAPVSGKSRASSRSSRGPFGSKTWSPADIMECVGHAWPSAVGITKHRTCRAYGESVGAPPSGAVRRRLHRGGRMGARRQPGPLEAHRTHRSQGLMTLPGRPHVNRPAEPIGYVMCRMRAAPCTYADEYWTMSVRNQAKTRMSGYPPNTIAEFRPGVAPQASTNRRTFLLRLIAHGPAPRVSVL